MPNAGEPGREEVVMANRECNGHFFQLDGAAYYECFWDGTLVDCDATPAMQGSKCPNCDRTIDGTNHGVVKKCVRTLTQAMIAADRIVTIKSEFEVVE